MKIIQSRSFERYVKKFSKSEKKALDSQIRKILDNNSIGQKKKGDLREIYVYKFKIKTIEYLLSYRFSNNVLELIMIGLHENYYKNLKMYLKGRKSEGN
jgi:mRNA-degrading endonuclease RelE of RelBE toxin-antitoxin system